jgi:CheY-like chemotaxis protein/anti-sigma regulatory factor (Ser/Thr protein kinase)
LLKNATERQEMLAKFQEAQKMKAIGRLAGGIAHDMNNILNAIIGSAHAHKQQISGHHGRFEDLQNITAACNRGAQLTQNLLDFARKSSLTKAPFSLNNSVDSVIAIINRTSLKNIQHTVKLDPRLPLIKGDQNQIESAIMNICLNAHDAMTQDGLLEIETYSHDDNVSVRVTDNGSGMDEKTRRRAFEPFFTTKPVGKGTGLGLSMVYGVTQSHDGHIEIDSAPGVGTTVTLSFPKAPPLAASTYAKPTTSREEKTQKDLLASQTVLLVDDEPLVLRAGTRMLQTLGCSVLSARNGREAIETFKSNRDAIGLVILDLIMPEMDGTETLAQLKAIAPSVPVLLASGYTQEVERVSELRESMHCGFLPKPYHPEELIAAANNILPHRAA